MPLIHGKQLRLNTLKAELLLVTGATETNGQLLSYDAGSGGFAWVDNTGGVGSVTAGPGLSGNTTTGDITLTADVDNNSIFIDGSNQITLGNPSTGDIGFPAGGTYRFTGLGNHVIFEGDFTVNGTTTFINSTNLAVSDNIIMINSGSTVGFGTAGISVDLGNGSFSDILWHESNGGYWGIDNPDGSGATQTYPIMTTASFGSADNTIVITQGTGTDFDKLDLVVDESNFSNIPNSALTNDSITINAGLNMGGGGTVALGGSITLSADTVNETWAEVLSNGNTSGGSDAVMSNGDVLRAASGDARLDLRYSADDYIYLGNNAGSFSGQTLYLAPDQSSLNWSDDASTYSTVLATADYASIWNYRNGKSNAVTAWSKAGSGVLDNRIEIASVTGSITMSAGTGNIYIQNPVATDNALTSVLARDPADGKLRQVDVSTLTGDNYVSGGSVTYTGPAHDNNSLTLTRTGGLIDVVIPNLEDTYVTGGTHSNGTLTFSRNDGGTFQITGLDSTDTFSTGGTMTTTPSDGSEDGVITIIGNDGFTPYTITGVNDTFLTGGTLTGSNLVLDQNSGNQITVDLSALDVNDTFSTGVTTNGGQIIISGNDGFTTFSGGTVVETVSTSGPGLTADTSNGDVTIGIDYSKLQISRPSKENKCQNGPLTGTTGNFAPTYITLLEQPIDAYVGVSVNGVWYCVGDKSNDPDTVDCYFSTDGGGTPQGFDELTTSSMLYWNGDGVGFDVDSGDSISIYYNILS